MLNGHVKFGLVPVLDTCQTRGGLLASVYHLTRIAYGIDEPEEVCIKVFAPRWNPRIPSVFWLLERHA